jgi:hypothetical protein
MKSSGNLKFFAVFEEVEGIDLLFGMFQALG